MPVIKVIFGHVSNTPLKLELISHGTLRGPHSTYFRIPQPLVATRFISASDSLAMLVNSCSKATIRTPYHLFIPGVHFACEDVDREPLFDISY